MIDEKRELKLALMAALESSPQISSAVINAGKVSGSLSFRKSQMATAIARTRALLDDLILRQARLGWQHRDDGDDA